MRAKGMVPMAVVLMAAWQGSCAGAGRKAGNVGQGALTLSKDTLCEREFVAPQPWDSVFIVNGASDTVTIDSLRVSLLGRPFSCQFYVLPVNWSLREALYSMEAREMPFVARVESRIKIPPRDSIYAAALVVACRFYVEVGQSFQQSGQARADTVTGYMAIFHLGHADTLFLKVTYEPCVDVGAWRQGRDAPRPSYSQRSQRGLVDLHGRRVAHRHAGGEPHVRLPLAR